MECKNYKVNGQSIDLGVYSCTRCDSKKRVDFNEAYDKAKGYNHTSCNCYVHYSWNDGYECLYDKQELD